MTQAVGLAPLLQLQQFDLQQPLLRFVLVAPHALVIRIVLPPRVDVYPAWLPNQHRVVVVIVTNGEFCGAVKHDHAQKVSAGAYAAVTQR